MKAVEAVSGHAKHAIMAVKTAHRRSPKKWLDQAMADFPGGTWIVLQGRTMTGEVLLAVGYKYNTKKVLTFVATRGAALTEPGAPYKARYADAHGNVFV